MLALLIHFPFYRQTFIDKEGIAVQFWKEKKSLVTLLFATFWGIFVHLQRNLSLANDFSLTAFSKSSV